MTLFMSKRDLELFLFDILVAIAKVEKTVENFTNADDLILLSPDPRFFSFKSDLKS